MPNNWWCANCRAPIELDIHGRCNTCGSDAVDRMERGGFSLSATPPLSGNQAPSSQQPCRNSEGRLSIPQGRSNFR